MIFILNVAWHEVQINAIVSCLHKVQKATVWIAQTTPSQTRLFSPRWRDSIHHQSSFTE